LFDVIQPKKLYGKEYIGVERSTFIFDKKGKLVKEFRNVKVKGHAEEVLDIIKTLE
jgi:peroxiredoxin Q/BCP